jgi:type IV conjugative transfer system coupling protein TraD
MSSANNSNFTRGAQLWAHNMRMAVQGAKNICLFGLATVMVLLAVRLNQLLTFETIYYYVIKCYVEFKLSIGSFFYSKNRIGIDYYSISKGHSVHKGAEEFIYQFWYETPYGTNINNFLLWLLEDAFFEVVASFTVGCSIALIFFIYRGRNILGTKKLRGSDLVTVKELSKILKRAKQASKIKISGLHLVKGSEMQHLLLPGTTGAGKTNMLKELLAQIKVQNDRAIIFDVTGEFVDRFYNPETDVILNPLREDSVCWIPWNDCKTDEEYNNLAAAFVDGESIQSDRYWEDAARAVLVEALKKQESTKSIESMLHVIKRVDFENFCEYFAGTDAAGYVSKESDKATSSVRSMLISKIRELKVLKDKGDFSIKDWVNNGNKKGWLFISCKPNDLDTLRALMSAWANIAIQGMLDRPHSGENEKMWFIMDELPAMRKIPSLATVLAQGRKYGACVVAGIQNIAQLERIYGRPGAQELLDLFRTKFFFAVGDNDIAEYASRALGEVEIKETRESLSYGSNTMRDGVNINSAVKIKRLVLPDELKNLEPNHCFVKLCGNYPITKLRVKLQAPSKLPMFFYKLFGQKKLEDTQEKPVGATYVSDDKVYHQTNVNNSSRNVQQNLNTNKEQELAEKIEIQKISNHKKILFTNLNNREEK